MGHIAHMRNSSYKQQAWVIKLFVFRKYNQKM